jgi:hypothetical protein
MRRLIFFAIGALEFSVVAVLLHLAYQIPGSAEINQGFQSAGQVTEKAGAQVRLLRDQVKTLQRMELHQISARLQKQAEIITSTLRSQTVDFETVGSMRDAVADLGKGLGDLAESFDPISISRLSNGLGETADFVEEKLVPAARKGVNAKDPSASVYQAHSEQLKMQDVTAPRSSSSGAAPAAKPRKGSIDLGHVLPEADRLKEVADSLRQAQTGLEMIQARWPGLRTRLKQLAGVLQATKGQLNQAIEHRQDYEDALEQTVQIADTLSLMLPLVTDQLDGRLDEEDRTLTDLGRNLDDVGRQLPTYERTAAHLFGAGRVLACLVAAIVGLHGFYLTFGSLRTRPDCKQTALRKCMDLSHNAIQHTMEPLSVSSFPAGRG